MALLAQLLPLAVEEGEEADSGLELLLPATNELIAGIIAFAIIFFFVWRWAVPAIDRALEQRQAAISGQIEEAEKAKAEAEQLRADYRSQLDDARSERNRIVEEARQEAEQIKGDIIARAEEEADQIRAKAREDAAAEKSRALAEARSQVGDLSVDLAEKIVEDSLDQQAHQALIDRYLADLERL